MLNQHLSEVESQTQQLFDMLARKVSEEEDLTEKLKEHDLMEWIRRNNNILKCATAIVIQKVAFWH